MFGIIHTPADMGTLAASAERVTIEKLGKGAWDEKVALARRFWNGVETCLERLGLSLPEVRVYQDGLPICGRERDIVAELASAGSPNHLILERLTGGGATLMGTEPPELLVEEHRLMQRILGAGDAAAVSRMEARLKPAGVALLERRDRAIADRINATLKPGETGILFIGLHHAVERRLAPDIRTIHPLHPSREASPAARS